MKPPPRLLLRPPLRKERGFRHKFPFRRNQAAPVAAFFIANQVVTFWPPGTLASDRLRCHSKWPPVAVFFQMQLRSCSQSYLARRTHGQAKTHLNSSGRSERRGYLCFRVRPATVEPFHQQFPTTF